MSKDFDLILFDLGGVLVELGESPIPTEWLPDNTRFQLQEWFSSATAKEFEKGLISPDQFANALKEELNIDVSSTDLLQQFTAWPKGLYPGVLSLLDQLSQHYSLAVLSNCNELHWPRMEHEFKIFQHMSHTFSSHLTHKIKPESSAFQRVLDDLNIEPRKVLFFDDNQENVDVANKLGIKSVLVKGGDELKSQLMLILENISCLK